MCSEEKVTDRMSNVLCTVLVDICRHIEVHYYRITSLCCVTRQWLGSIDVLQNTTLDLIFYKHTHLLPKLILFRAVCRSPAKREFVPNSEMPISWPIMELSTVYNITLIEIISVCRLIIHHSQQIRWGVYRFHSVRLSGRPSVRPACRVRSVTPTVIDGFFPY